MKVITASHVKKESFSTTFFTGPKLSIQRLLPESLGFDVNIVNFGKGTPGYLSSSGKKTGMKRIKRIFQILQEERELYGELKTKHNFNTQHNMIELFNGYRAPECV